MSDEHRPTKYPLWRFGIGVLLALPVLAVMANGRGNGGAPAQDTE